MAGLAAGVGKGRAGVAALLLLLAGCAGTPSTPPAQAPGVPVAPAARAAPLEVERQWLQSWFEGTPVVIAVNADGALDVAVPREFCFAPGQHTVKPALAAVLDKVAESLRRQRQVQLDLVAAPGDGVGGVSGGAAVAAASDAALSRRRAAAVRQHLRARGVPDARLAAATILAAPKVQLRLALPSR